MIFLLTAILTIALITVYRSTNSHKVQDNALGWFLTFIITGVMVLIGFAAMGDAPSKSEKGLVQETSTQVVSITHSVGGQKYIVELDKGSYKTVEEYDLTYQNPILKNSQDKTMEEVYVKMPVMNWAVPWEYHRAHEDIIHFPANEIKVVP